MGQGGSKYPIYPLKKSTIPNKDVNIPKIDQIPILDISVQEKYAVYQVIKAPIILVVVIIVNFVIVVVIVIIIIIIFFFFL